jgi:hypothetical protein
MPPLFEEDFIMNREELISAIESKTVLVLPSS